MIKRIPLLLLSALLVFFTACDKDSDNANNPDNSNPSGNNTGTADVDISGAVTAELGDYATWEITEQQLLRIRVGGAFPPNIVLNFRLGSTELSDFKTGAYQAVSATYTGQPDDEMALQYNGDEIQFPDSGTITINTVENSAIEGDLAVAISPLNGASSQVNGTFTAAPLE